MEQEIGVKHISRSEPLDVMTLPLWGVRLIEASAGTGKTYTLIALYLRLLLGLKGDSSFARLLTVPEILVVTFTKAATEELKGRIRQSIHLLRLGCQRGTSQDPLILQFLHDISDKQAASQILLLAEQQMDEAAIYTIHGFCQRVLQMHAFESGILFEQTLLQDNSPLLQRVVADFWRRSFYPLPLQISQDIVQLWQSPQELQKALYPYLVIDASAIRQPLLTMTEILAGYEQNQAQVSKVKADWLQCAPELLALIQNSDVNKRSYSSRNLPLWLQKVTEWAEESSASTQLCPELKNFRQSLLLQKSPIEGKVPQNLVFSAIDSLFDNVFPLKESLLIYAVAEVKKRLAEEKQRSGDLDYDDLLLYLEQALRGVFKTHLVQAIEQRYPIALIDEFQDTDPKQYQIFRTLYSQARTTTTKESGLLLIGDPKQAIYAFRGADIFTYLAAKKETTAHYTLITNWRSAPQVVHAVNHIFQTNAIPFVFQQIDFLPVEAAKSNDHFQFVHQNEPQPAMTFWMMENEAVTLAEYQEKMAMQCAMQIRQWLSDAQNGTTFYQKMEQESIPLKAEEIAILVRSAKEAKLMQAALQRYAIPSVFLSNRESVFATAEARDLLWFLQAVLYMERENRLRCALASELFDLNASELEMLNLDDTLWDEILAEFARYRHCWQKKGVLAMIKLLLSERQLAERMMSREFGERRLVDILHLGELLQEAAAQHEQEYALIHWFAVQITQPNGELFEQQLRLENDQNLVKIITIHKSKGLEYPIVCLPFIMGFRNKEALVYHDRNTFSKIVTFSPNSTERVLMEEERLAEDLRLLYVALTRAQFHCALGVAAISSGSKKSKDQTQVHLSALGYLLQEGKWGGADLLFQKMAALNALPSFHVAPLSEVIITALSTPIRALNSLQANQFERSLNNHWRITSYSRLQQSQGFTPLALLPHFDDDLLTERNEGDQEEQTPHTFPKGASAGTFLHGLLEKLDFNELFTTEEIAVSLQQAGFAEKWQTVLFHWLTQIVQTPLGNSGFCLTSIANHQKQTELHFYLPIARPLKAEAFNALTRKHDALSKKADTLSFEQIEGMITGFIDLVFYAEGRYYLVDYKSNWLGDSAESYTQEALEKAIIEHRYDLQYQLYTLALHRYLAHRLPDYDYEQHFGGVYYLFLRGMTKEERRGVFFNRPSQIFVESLDALFSGESLNHVSSTQTSCDRGKFSSA